MANTINRPGHHNIKLAPLCLLQHLVEARAILAPLDAADTRIAESLDYLPSSRRSHLAESRNLIFHGLPICADTNV
jgi:hypothetical protein